MPMPNEASTPAGDAVQATQAPQQGTPALNDPEAAARAWAEKNARLEQKLAEQAAALAAHQAEIRRVHARYAVQAAGIVDPDLAALVLPQVEATVVLEGLAVKGDAHLQTAQKYAAKMVPTPVAAAPTAPASPAAAPQAAAPAAPAPKVEVSKSIPAIPVPANPPVPGKMTQQQFIREARIRAFGK